MVEARSRRKMQRGCPAMKKSIFWAAIALQFCLPNSAASAGETYYYYYCPHSDALLSGSNTELSGRAANAYPRQYKDGHLVPREYAPLWTWYFTDCSSSEFVCIDARNAVGKYQRRLFLPRKIEAGRQYTNGSSRAIVYEAATPSRGVLQVVLWEKTPSGEEVPLKLMWERQRGVVNFDGLVVSGLGGAPETCALQSKTGYFADVSLARMRTAPVTP